LYVRVNTTVKFDSTSPGIVVSLVPHDGGCVNVYTHIKNTRL
jgi:hypothetical protein